MNETGGVIVQTGVIRSRRLSLSAKGLYALLLAHEPEMVTVDRLELSPLDGEQLKPAMQELIAAGLIRWTQE